MIVYLNLESFNLKAEKFLLQVNCRSRGFVPFEVGGDFVWARLGEHTFGLDGDGSVWPFNLAFEFWVR